MKLKFFIIHFVSLGLGFFILGRGRGFFALSASGYGSIFCLCSSAVKKDTAAETAKKREQERQRQAKLAETNQLSRYRRRSRSRSYSNSPPRYLPYSIARNDMLSSILELRPLILVSSIPIHPLFATFLPHFLTCIFVFSSSRLII